MKARLKIATTIIGFALALTTFAGAQNLAKTTIPFDFQVGNTTLAAGDYTIVRLLPNSPDVLALRDSSGKQVIVFQGIRTEAGSDEHGSRLVFNRYEDRYFLAQVWVNAGDGASVPKGTQEKRLLLGDNQQPTTFAIPGK
jgi:hypothetical protein